MSGTFYRHSAYIQEKTFNVRNKRRTLLSLNESDLRALQNLVGELSIAGVPAFLYNLIERAPDSFFFQN